MTHITRPVPVRQDRIVPKVISAHTSARSESAVVIDLLSQGFDVYRSVGDHAIVDLIAMHRVRILGPLAVEVKTGVIPHRSNPARVYLRPLPPNQRWMADIVAIVDPRDLAVFYVFPRDVSLPAEVPTVDLLSLSTEIPGMDDPQPINRPEWVEVGATDA